MAVTEPQFEIQKPADNCLLCGKSLTDEQRHASVLTAQANQHVRKDYCRDCWRKLKDRHYFCFWVAKRLKPAPGKLESKRRAKAMLYDLYNDLSTKSPDDYASHLFILAHLLMRLKVFKWEATWKDDTGNEKIRFHDVQRDSAVVIAVPTISEEQLAALKSQLFSIIT